MEQVVLFIFVVVYFLFPAMPVIAVSYRRIAVHIDGPWTAILVMLSSAAACFIAHLGPYLK